MKLIEELGTARYMDLLRLGNTTRILKTKELEEQIVSYKEKLASL